MNTKELQEIITNGIHDSSAISNEMCSFFFSPMDKYILGTGRQAAVVLEMCRNMKVDIKGLISEDNFVPQMNVDNIIYRRGYWKDCIVKTPVISIEELICKEDSQIILTVDKKYYSEFESYLMEYGIKRELIFGCMWEHNTDIKKILYKAYMTDYNNWRVNERSSDYIVSV